MVTIDKSNFYNSYRYIASGAVSAFYSNISIKDFRFNKNNGLAVNVPYSRVTVDSIEFNYNDGGAISVDESSKLKINGTIFNGNGKRALRGGAISMRFNTPYGSRTDTQERVFK